MRLCLSIPADHDRYSEDYLENTSKRNSKVKTLIYRHVPKELYSFYECVGVRYNDKIIKTDNIKNIISINNLKLPTPIRCAEP